MSACQPGTFVDAGNFRITFVGTTDQGEGIVRWCWNIAFIGESGPALSHWDIQTCPNLGLGQLVRLLVTDITGAPMILINTTDPNVIADFVEFANGFPDGFQVYGMKTDLGFTQAELEPGETWQFCYDFDESEVPLEPVLGSVAVKSGPGMAADAIVFGLCVPGCGGAAVAPRRGYGL